MYDAVWTITTNDRTIAILCIAFALWLFLTLALMKSNCELKKQWKERRPMFDDFPRTRFSWLGEDERWELLTDLEDRQNHLKAKLEWPDEEDEPFIEEMQEELEEVEDDLRELYEELGI